MKFFVVMFAAALVACAAAADDQSEFCYNDIVAACRSIQTKLPPKSPPFCNARYGGFPHLEAGLQEYINTHLVRQYEYLLLATYYGNYAANRPGFSKLFREMSDELWQDAIDTIKYVTKRGGSVDFSRRKELNDSSAAYELSEIESVGKALDYQKQLAEDAFAIHSAATRRHEHVHDPEVAQHIEERFAEKHAKQIRRLTGYATDLGQLVSSRDASLALFLFDEYLQKQ